MGFILINSDFCQNVTWQEYINTKCQEIQGPQKAEAERKIVKLDQEARKLIKIFCFVLLLDNKDDDFPWDGGSIT